jgi:hypothetical protein
MKKVNLLIFALVVIISILAATIYLRRTPVTEETVQQSAPPTIEKPEKQAIVHYPVPVPATVEEPAEAAAPEKLPPPAAPTPVLPAKLPPVEQSDQSIEDALANLKLKKSLFNLILLENFIQRLVTTIDNLPEKRLPRAHLPLIPPKGRFIIAGTEQAPQTSQRNQSRYDAHIQLLESLDQQLVVKVYVYFYPLFQTAFEQLGYKNAYFNDRLVFVIDHLLETPDPAEPLLLAQPSVLYTYADPLLEKLSSGQKTLLRIGPQHRQKVLTILQSYREQLVNLRP